MIIQDAILVIDAKKQVRHSGDHGAQARFALFQRAFCGAFGALVAEDEHNAQNVTAAIANGRGRVGNRPDDAMPVAQQSMVAQLDRALFAQHNFDRIDNQRLTVFIDNCEDFSRRSAARLGVRPAGQRLGHRVEQRDVALGVGGDHALTDAAQRDRVANFAGAPRQLCFVEPLYILPPLILRRDQRQRAQQPERTNQQQHQHCGALLPAGKGFRGVNFSDEKPG